MDDVPESRELSDATVAAMVREVDPDRGVETVTRVDRGFCSVYRIGIADADSTLQLYLKASPDGQPWAIPTEARIQATLEAHTSVPVPEVLGVVDDHDTLPTPYYLMRGLPGDELAYERIGRVDDETLDRLARETGRYLAALHSVPAVDRFGHVRHDGPDLTGGRPVGDPSTLTVGDPHETWPSFLREYVDRELERHADSRFSDLTPALRRWFEAGLDDLDGPFEPVLGRNDHGLHNLLVDPETGEVTAMLDWGYTLAVPAAFDFEFAVYLYSGAFLAGRPDVSDRRPLVREAMLAGYRAIAPELAARVSTPEPCYEAAAMVRIMNDFDSLTLPDGSESAVMERIRTDVRTLLE
ncbi:phosphotransferase family protein [Halopiger djelfimassiliensis]|uniref:phosphotransferase family protein n=1 Tax=Halopiger djelfimassiliensis TaxID=1293047 RepID=UPI000677F6C7|nr:aminoglycoside phosphotransferase family protein [Halopiger djelfimassiliensis]